MREILMEVRSSHACPVVIGRGIATRLGTELARRVDVRRPLTILGDERVAELHEPTVRASLAEAGWRLTPTLTFPPGEGSKTWDTARDLLDRLVQHGVHRRGVLVALGGGVVTDTVGFVASVYMRGVGYVNVPTTLMAQVDAAVGGKTAVNHATAKNLIGSFHQPLAVFTDPDLLETLPAVERRNGMAEVVKIAIIADPELFAVLEDLPGGAPLDGVIATAVARKVELAGADPFEDDLRRPLNFGHTFAHPLEVAGGFALRHGFAVAVGMSIVTRVALARRLIEEDAGRRILALLERFGLPTRGPPVDPVGVWRAAAMVRRVRGDHLHAVLPTAVGATVIVDDLEQDEFLAAWEAS